VTVAYEPRDAKLTCVTEITQTSKMRKKEEFLRAFEPILADATQVAYKGSPADTQNKIRRVVEVWRVRQIFNPAVQQEVEKKLNGMSGLLIGRKRQC
jgi:regulator of Ty1 transposition protein 103